MSGEKREVGKTGSVEWLVANAWFPCGYCEDADELTVHPARDLAMWDGKTICDDCWSGVNGDTMPQTWSALDPFTPFAFLEDKE